MRTSICRMFGAAAFMVLLVSLAMACGGEKPVIRVHVWEGTDSHWINNAIFAFIAEKGYGYPVETVVETTPELKEALPRGDVDLNLEGWQQNIPDWYNEHTRNGSIVNLGMTFEGGPQFFMIPAWVAEEYDIKTVFDMKDHWKVFQDPRDPTRGVFYSCLIAHECAGINAVKLEAYGLTKYYNVVSPGSTAALEAALATPQENRQPVFGYYWAPNPLMGAYQWYILKEPPYTDECWENVIAAVDNQDLRPIDQACAYESVPIDKLAHKGLQGKAPDIVDMLRKMKVGLGPLNRASAWAYEYGIEDWEKVAVYYLQTFDDRWEAWVTPEAYDRVRKALVEASLASK